MQFANDDEENDFTLNSAARSRLSSLFQGEGSSGDVNQALTFTAPKQPRKNDNAQSNPGTFKLIHTGVVHAYKLKDGNYANQGKLGCAILGLQENAIYKFLLYKGKQVQVTSCNIVPSFKFHVQPNNYVNFYDDKNENWSINFDSESALSGFAKQVALAKANSEDKNPSSLIIQDFVLGEGPSLDKGDSAEVKYTGWLLTNYSFGQVFDSNMKSETSFRLRLGKSKVIKGWSEGLIGAQKGCKRLLIIPPSLAYGSEGMGSSVPPNSTLIFDVHVIKVKISRESSHSPSPKVHEPVPERKPEVLPRPSITQEDNIRLRGASISEQLSQSPKKDKAHLISRMAKMGTATLPLQGAIPAQVSSESENEEDTVPESPPVQLSGSRTASPKPFSKPNSRKNSASVAVAQSVQSQSVQENIPIQITQHSSQMSLYSQAALPAQQPYLTPTSTFPTYQPQLASQFQVPQPQFPMHNIPGMMPAIATSMADTHLPLLITETRSQNTEVRLSLAKITDKMDTVIQKVDDVRLNQGRASSMAHVPFMDSAILVQNIERIVQENSQLKEDIEAKNSKIQILNDRIHDLFQRNQRFYEENNSIMEQRSETMQVVSAQAQEKLWNLEREKEKITLELSEAVSKIKTLESELNRYQNQESVLNHKLSEYKQEIEKPSNDSSKDNESLINSLQNQLKNVEDEKRLTLTKLEELEKHNRELMDSITALKKRLEETESKIDEVKSNSIKEQTELEESYKKQLKNYEEQIKQAPSASGMENSLREKYNEIEILKKEKDHISSQKKDLQSNIEDLKTQLKTFETSEEMHKKKVLEMQSEVQNSLLWKKKYEVFYQKTRALKESYDNKISELTAEIKQLQVAGANPVSTDFSGEIKKVMNMLYRLLQGKFDPKESYQGSKVLELTLQSIKGLTFQMLEMKSRTSSESSAQDIDAGKTSTETVKSSSKVSDQANELKVLPGTTDSNSRSAEIHLQQNGLNEKSISLDTAAEPESSSVTAIQIANERTEETKIQNNCDSEVTNDKLVAEPKTEESTLNRNSIDSDVGFSEASNVKTTEISEEPTPQPVESKVTNHVDNLNRVSPDSSQLQSSTNLFADPFSETVGNKIWRPQPPLFDDDDDEDEDDDDDWLK